MHLKDSLKLTRVRPATEVVMASSSRNQVNPMTGSRVQQTYNLFAEEIVEVVRNDKGETRFGVWQLRPNRETEGVDANKIFGEGAWCGS